MSISIYLGDLGYFNDYNFSQPTPLNVGYIGEYLRTQVPEARVELFKNPVEMLERIRHAPPQILGLSHYQWNSNLNLKVIEAAKSMKPDVVSVLGGPQFDATNLPWIADFFSARPNVDFHIEREGEITFSELVKLLINSGLDKTQLDQSLWPSTLFSVDRQSRMVLSNPNGTFERLDLSTISSPYLAGRMDKFLDDPHLAPIVETNRGCPYSCSFCAWGSATQSKVRQFPLEQVVEEIKYVTARSANPQKLLYLADANFGMLKRDEDIAKTIAACGEKSKFPKQTYVYFAKNTNKQVIRVAELMRSVTSMSMSKQSVNESVLENIKRKNIPHQQYDTLSLECEKRGITTFSELIYGLPGETYESFVNGVIQTVRQKASVAMYPMLLIEGAENHTVKHRQEFDITTKYRVIPRYISTMSGLRTLEYEEVGISNSALPFEDWLKIRQFHFLMVIFGSEVFRDLKRELEAHELDYASLAKRILEDTDSWPSTWASLCQEFRQASMDELIEEEDIRIEYSPDEMKDIELKFPAQNYYYFAKFACSRKTVDEFHAYLSNGVSRLFPQSSELAQQNILQSLDLSFDRLICYEDNCIKKDVSYDINIEKWEANVACESYESYKLQRPVKFQLVIEESIKTRLDSLLQTGLSLVDAVYKLRNGFIGFRGDVVFAYKRTQRESH